MITYLETLSEKEGGDIKTEEGRGEKANKKRGRTLKEMKKNFFSFFLFFSFWLSAVVCWRLGKLA